MLNRVVLIGRLTKDVDLRYTQSGKAVANFTLAVDRNFSKEATDFIRVLAWGGQAENCDKYLSKGKLAAVDGRLQISTYDKDGVKHTSAEVIADSVQFLSPKTSNSDAPAVGIGEDMVGDDDLPF
jgi:single-strand DNA-binding protein